MTIKFVNIFSNFIINVNEESPFILSLVNDNYEISDYLLDLDPSIIDNINNNDNILLKVESIFSDTFCSIDNFIKIYNYFPNIKLKGENNIFFKLCCE